MSIASRQVTVRHWLPIMTWCPVSNMPDLVYASVTWFDNKDHELYAVRRRIRKLLAGRKCFMEELAVDLAKEFPDAHQVTVSLAFNRHYVAVFNNVS